jgi:hypothetical protein
MGQLLSRDFYGIVTAGPKGLAPVGLFIGNLMRNFGGDIVDANDKPTFK